jgi:DNA-binding SARP family transcriptional activator
MSSPLTDGAEESAAETLSIRVLGTLEVVAADGQSRSPTARKSQELLGYLLLHRGKPVRREWLSGLLWVDRDPRACRKNLRQALWRLQSALGTEAARELLDITPDTIRLREDAHLELDVAAFQRAADGLRGVDAASLTADAAVAADLAVELYRGDLLEDFDLDWCFVEREWLRSTYLLLLDKLIVYCTLRGEYDRGVEYGERVLRCDRAREYTHRHLMHLHHLRGDRTSALRQYVRCVRALDEELAVPPSDATVALRRTVLDDGAVDPDTRRGANGVGDQLLRLRTALTDLQSRVESELWALQPAPPPSP